MQPLIVLTFLGTQYNEVQSAILVSAVLGIVGILLFIAGKLIGRTAVAPLRWIFYILVIPIALLWIWFVGISLFTEGLMAVCNYIIHDVRLVLLTVGFFVSAGFLPKTFSSGSGSKKGYGKAVVKSGDKWYVDGVGYDDITQAREMAKK